MGEFLKALVRGEVLKERNITITFTTKLSDNSEVELLPNGKNIVVDSTNVEEYVKLAESRRLVESEKQVSYVNIPFLLILQGECNSKRTLYYCATVCIVAI